MRKPLAPESPAGFPTEGIGHSSPRGRGASAASLAGDFERDGFLVLPGVLTAAQVAELNAATDRHRQQFPRLWLERGEGGRSQSVHALLSCPQFDSGILHPVVLPLVEALMGDDVVFEEHSVMIRAPIAQDPPATAWHRDVRHLPEQTFCLYSLSVVYYLSDVDESTHCFACVPESAAVKRGPPAQLPACDGAAGRDLLGPAGTAVLFNAGSCHAGRLRCTPRERRTVHIYYGHASQPPLSEHTVFPRRLSHHRSPRVRRLFARPNQITRAVDGQP